MVMIGFGQTSFNFLVRSFNAESVAGGNSIWVSSLLTPQEHLPSEMNQLNDMNISYSTQTWLKDISSRNIFMATRFDAFGFGLYFKYYGIEGIEERNNPSIDPIGTFDNSTTAIGFSASYQLIENLALGYTIKFLVEKNHVFSANGSASDVSLSYRYSDFVAFINVTNFQSEMDKLDQTRSTVPEKNVFGFKTDVFDVNLGIEFHNQSDVDATTHLFAYHEFFDALTVFTGYVLNSDVYSFSGGLRFEWENMHLSYGYALHKDLDNMTNLQLGIRL